MHVELGTAECRCRCRSCPMEGNKVAEERAKVSHQAVGKQLENSKEAITLHSVDQ